MNGNSLNVHSAFAQYFSKDELNPWLYQLSKTMEAGNVCLDIHQNFLEEETATILNAEVLKTHYLVGGADALLPFILHENKLYLHRFFHYERRLVQQIKALIANEEETADATKLLSHKDFINKELFRNNEKLQTVDWQKVACINAFLNKFSIISGGPGTGKTTTVTKLLALYLMDNPNATISICAPTGKAAARLEESISQAEKHFKEINIAPEIVAKIKQLKASTIHSLLGYIPNSIHFKHNADNTLDADILIVDECSMIDMALFYKLFQAIDTTRTKVILLGDKNQLASVDAGSVFRDLCSDTVALNTFSAIRADFINQFIERKNQQLQENNISEKQDHPLFQHIIELQTSYRFSDDAGIGKLSKAILNNDKEAIADFLNNSDPIIVFKKPEALDETLNNAIALLDESQNGYIGLKDIAEMLPRITNSTVLCAIKDGRFGLRAINNEIVNRRFSPSGKYFSNQLIMVNKNQASDGIYNGDMGLVLENENGLKIYFSKSGTEYMALSPAQINASETAFAMTIHKSQGSEFNEVFIILPDNEANLLLSRELLYTAITRAKKKVTIVGTAAVIYAIASKSVKRVSGIAEHFN